MARKRKSTKRSRAAKLGWARKRRSGGVRRRNPRRRKRKNPRRRRRRNPYYKTLKSGRHVPAYKGEPGAKYVRVGRGSGSWYYGKKSKKRRKKTVKRGKKRKSSTRKRRSPRRYRRYKYPSRSRKYRSRSAAAKLGWRRRRHDKSYRTVSGRKYRRPAGRRRKPGRKRGRGAYYYPRYKNPNFKDLAIPLLLGAVGFIGAMAVVNKTPATLTSKLPAGTAGVVLPLAAGLALSLFVAKKLPAKYKGAVVGIGTGMALFGVVAALKQYVLPKLPAGAKAALGLSGYVRRPIGMSGYTVAPFMSGYVPARAGGSLGQFEERIPRTLGASVEVRGGQKLLAPPFKEALGYQSQAQKPYGLGMPTEERRYNRFTWFGVYDLGIYE